MDIAKISGLRSAGLIPSALRVSESHIGTVRGRPSVAVLGSVGGVRMTVTASVTAGGYIRVRASAGVGDRTLSNVWIHADLSAVRAVLRCGGV